MIYEIIHDLEYSKKINHIFELKIQLLKGTMYNRLNNRLANDGEQMS